MIIAINILIIITTLINYYYLLLLFQENHYHISFIKIVLNKVIKNFKYYFLLTPLLFYFDNIICNVLILIVLTIYLYIVFKTKYIIKLKITKRIKRFIVLKLLFIIIYLIIFNKHICLMPFISLAYLIISYYLLLPLEYIINKYYVIKAKNKIDKINPIVIGITGSCGKTTLKNIIYELLKDKYICFKTKESYNTQLGIARSINEDMNKMTEVAIIEFGASHKNDIKKSMQIVKPKISIITNIGINHLETFKTIDNLVKEKTLLLKNSNLHFYNALDTYDVTNINTITFSFDKKADYYITNYNASKNGSVFTVNCYNEDISFTSNLLGRKNIENLVCAIAVARKLGCSYEEIKRNVSKIKPVKNRLELIKINNLQIINDSFNSNKQGFLEALYILNMFDDRKIIITPGIVTGGNQIREINRCIASTIIKYKFDCILIDSIVSKYYEDVFKESGYKYLIMNSFIDAYEYVINNKYDVLLIENDISDIYRR